MPNYSKIQIGSIVRHKLLDELKKCDKFKVIEVLSNNKFRCECQKKTNYIRDFDFDELIIVES